MKYTMTTMWPLCLVLMANIAQAQAPQRLGEDLEKQAVLRLCTAQAGNNYHLSGQKIAEALAPSLRVRVIETKGSWENLETMSSSRPRCDAILAQDDAVALHRFQHPESKLAMERMTTLFEEKTHLLCNRKVEAKRFRDIKPRSITLYTNEYGSGSYISWRVMSKLNEAYRQHRPIEKGLDEALLSLLDNQQPACLFYVSRQGGKTLNRANQNFGDRLKLVEISDSKLEQRVDRLQRKLYRPSKIEQSDYANLLESDIDTLSVNAVFFLSTEWKAKYPLGTKRLSDTLLDLLSQLNKSSQ